MHRAESISRSWGSITKCLGVSGCIPFLSEPTQDEVFDAGFKSQSYDIIRSIDAEEIICNSNIFDVPFSVDLSKKQQI